jgi:membrane protein YdbS with pleckstrin-like domain
MDPRRERRRRRKDDYAPAASGRSVSYCIRCGAQLPQEARFCAVCGTPVGPATASTSPLPAVSPATVRPPPSAPSNLDLRPIPVPADLPFHPQSDEVIYREIRPHPRLLWRLMLGGILSALVFLIFIIPFSISFFLSGAPGGTLIFVVVFLVVVFGLIVIGSVMYATLAYRKFRYWITNHRTVGRRGVIGYSIDSIPLETISDVVVQRSVADRILGLSSIWVQPFGGSSSGGYGAAQYRFGTISGTNSFLGLVPADATNVQQLIFHLRDVRRRETGRLI